VAAVFFARTLSTLLFGVTPGDPLTLTGTLALLAAATLAAAYLPARRAGRVDPTSVFASE
jgi:ABC-type lipoprotein release transport system permease subunit